MVRGLLGRLRESRWYAGLVQERARYMLRDLSGRAGEATYRPRDGGDVHVIIRHGTSDPWVMHEVWRSGEYEPPPEADEVLRAADPLRVVELGGHIGLFGAAVLSRYPHAQLTAVEPDPANAATLRRAIALNGGEQRWRLIEACAATHEGTLGFMRGQGAESHVASADEEPDIVLPAIDALPLVTQAELVKMDLEGSEWPILEDARFAVSPPRVLVMEWHSVPGVDWDNPKRRAVEILEPLGFRIHHPPAYADLPLDEPLFGAGVLWAWRP